MKTNRELLISNDGSATVFDPEVNECFHSRHGAFQESTHVFIQSGLLNYISKYNPSQVSILEVGLGTALNAFLSLSEFYKINTSILYHGVEKYPLSSEIFVQLKYEDLVDNLSKTDFLMFHLNNNFSIHNKENSFTFQKHSSDILELDESVSNINVCFFDAFAPDKQPELWTVDAFASLNKRMSSNGILVTYSSKGQVRRNLIEAGFEVEKIPGPKYKREMLRAQKK